jgi:uncharacterized membrane protein (DUF106 family)
MKPMFKFVLAMLIPIAIFSMWDKYPAIKSAVHAVLDPSLGFLLSWNLIIGFILITALLAFIQTLAQKFLTNQEELKKLKAEQKILQEEMKKYKDHPEKLMELQKKSLEFIPRTMDLTLNSVFYTTVPFILLFRWFQAYLVPIWGGWWILYYLLGTLFFSQIFRKMLDVA